MRQDILFPRATVTRLAKSVLESDDSDKSQFILSKDSLTVIQRSSVVFISHLFHHALQNSKAEGRKTTSALDVMNALNNTGFGSYAPALEEELRQFNEREQAKKAAKLKTPDVAADGDAADDANKRAKTNDGRTKKSDPDAEDAEEEDDDDEDDVYVSVEEDVEEAEDSESDTEEPLKPSQVLSQEHKELAGEDEPDATKEEDDDDEEEED